MIKVFYTIFLGLIIALFVGIGINTFYRPPVAPEFPATDLIGKPVSVTDSSEQTRLDAEFKTKNDAYQKDLGIYNRNVSLLVVGIAILLLIVSLLIEGKVAVIDNGILLGSLLILIYGIMRSFSGEDMPYRFIVISIGLAVTILLGYLKFIRPAKPAKA